MRGGGVAFARGFTRKVFGNVCFCEQHVCTEHSLTGCVIMHEKKDAGCLNQMNGPCVTECMGIERYDMLGFAFVLGSLLTSTIEGLVIWICVITGVVFRPRVRWGGRVLCFAEGMPAFIPAGVGAVVAVALGLVALPMLVTILGRTWDASFTLIGLFMLAAALDANNFFDWAAQSLAHLAGGSRVRLYLLLCLLSLGLTVFFGNDGNIMGATPIVAKLVIKIFKEERKSWWPYLFATGFLADAFSAVLVPANLTNIIVASTYHLPFILFAVQMAFPMTLASIVAIICFGLRFASVFKVRGRAGYNTAHLDNPRVLLKDQLTFRVGWVALVVLIAGHLVIGGVFHQPVSFVVIPVAAVMLGLGQARGIGQTGKILRDAPWEVLLYALAMFVVITAAMTPLVIAAFMSIAPLYALLVGGGSTDAVGLLTAGGIMAILSAISNNLPATLVGVLLLSTAKAPPMFAINAIILGVNIGPKLTPYGSLATILWLGLLKKQGIEISWGQCLKENWWVTVLALLAALGGLWVVSLL